MISNLILQSRNCQRRLHRNIAGSTLVEVSQCGCLKSKYMGQDEYGTSSRSLWQSDETVSRDVTGRDCDHSPQSKIRILMRRMQKESKFGMHPSKSEAILVSQEWPENISRFVPRRMPCKYIFSAITDHENGSIEHEIETLACLRSQLELMFLPTNSVIYLITSACWSGMATCW